MEKFDNLQVNLLIWAVETQINDRAKMAKETTSDNFSSQMNHEKRQYENILKILEGENKA